ncbi:peptidylprolyl isomerase [Candidatus Woesearchaeota archaeon]|nr:peptidylprolyl isomerase [Candidatus Woesearchaeota archaeon]
MALQKNDVIEFSYTGRFKTGELFDTTDEELAKKENLWNSEMKYGTKMCILGKETFLKGLEESLIGKELGAHKIELEAKKAFGVPDAKLRQLVPTGQFTKQNIRPRPGLQVNIDGAIGVVRTVSGGRTLIDFNHPFAGKDVVYDVEVKKVITGAKEKAEAFLSIIGMEATAQLEGDSIVIKTKKNLGKEGEEFIKNEIKELTGKSANINVEKEEKEKQVTA